jgi:hypothetical protein
MKPRVNAPPSAARSPSEAEAHPREDGDGHPIERRDYLLTTPAIKALFDHVCEWVDFAIPGAIIAGRPRVGKTRAIEALTVLLEWRYPGLPVHWIFCEDHEQITERTFFEDALRDAGHSYVKQGTARDKRNRLIEALLQGARERDQRRVVVFADEAQRLRERQYNWLVDVHNALDRRGVALIVFLVGQPELVDIRAGLLEASKLQIVNRFMVEARELRGVSSPEELRDCLAAYDAKQWPRHGGVSYPAYFLPEAARAGWRLADIAQELWECFDLSRRPDRRGTRLVLPMFHLCRVVELLLMTSRGGPEGVISRAEMAAAVKQCNFATVEAFGG